MADAQYYFSGQSGTFYWGDDPKHPSGNCRDWSFSVQMATLDATTLGDTYKVPVNGIRTITGAATLFWSRGDSRNRDQTAGDAAQWLITKNDPADRHDPGHAAEAGGSNKRIKLRLKVEGAGGDTGTFKGRGIEMYVKLTNLAMSMAHGEIFAANITFECIGAPLECNL